MMTTGYRPRRPIHRDRAYWDARIAAREAADPLAVFRRAYAMLLANRKGFLGPSPITRLGLGGFHEGMRVHSVLCAHLAKKIENWDAVRAHLADARAHKRWAATYRRSEVTTSGPDPVPCRCGDGSCMLCDDDGMVSGSEVSR